MGRLLLSFALILGLTAAAVVVLAGVFVVTAGPTMAGGQRAVVLVGAGSGLLPLCGAGVYSALAWRAEAHWGWKLGLTTLLLAVGWGVGAGVALLSVILLNR